MTYQPDFSGIWAKIDRGEQHRQALESELGGWVFGPDGIANLSEANRIPMSMEFDRESGYHIFRAAARPSEDDARRWGIIIGDAVHNFRSALDHLVWQLSFVGTGGRGPSDPDRVQFSIDDNPSPSNPLPRDFQKTGKLHALKPNHRAIIHGYQPYDRQYAPNLPGNLSAHPIAGPLQP